MATDFQSMTTDQLVEWAETNSKDGRLYIIRNIIEARRDQALENIQRTIRELGIKAQEYLDNYKEDDV